MQILRKTKHWLEESPIYMRFRYSHVVYLLWLWYRKDVRKDIKAKEKWYEQVVPFKKELAFDIGANEGILTNIFTKHFKQVIAIEPSARNLRILKAKFHSKQNVQLLSYAVSNIKGEQLFYEDRTDYALGTMSEKWNVAKQREHNPDKKSTLVKTTTLTSLIIEYGTPDYIKIDVEGNEQKVIQGLTQRVPLLSFEAMLPLFLNETETCIQHLHALANYVAFNVSFDEHFLFEKALSAEQILKEIKSLRSTVEVWCWM